MTTTQQIGIIGAGNMATAITHGIIKNQYALSSSVHVFDPDQTKLTRIKDELRVIAEKDNIALTQHSDLIILAVKPNIYPSVIAEIRDYVTDSKTIVTIAAGQKISKIEELFGKPIAMVRVMPNTPALVGAGMSALTPNTLISKEKKEEVLQLFNCLGKAEFVPEKMMDAVTGLSGSSPAFVFMFIEALSDAAVQGGMPRQQAYTFAAQTVLGSAKLLLESEKHPGVLKDMVTSPSGTTIEGVLSLEKNGFRGIVAQALQATIQKSIDMSKEA
ncbi:pyrroline-5-carboxylate reductase [Pseudoramibacter sp.]|uniref:pyrroline-5-carboxylate reductase n=1 Tax=Pseudoramibacter sp. TaxID=2034862 RepID=UPI0025FD4EEB|nr:pyrroline-5-carboxylate reductase [Pseudoramibacter sp.]MCH4072905.1 pyrroline-5-carboxylate reductase [Pseudoramibacter sp.]MCH4106676.1 pyrroline-5-carboxylate reductase [Pseudoramibacter sp.]